MDIKLRKSLDELARVGWAIEMLQKPKPLPDDIVARYPWIPAEYRALVEKTKNATSADDKAWLLTTCDYSNTSDSAYAWNEWERQSLEAACDDAHWQTRIRQFWNTHLPILLSVKSGYAHFAIESTSLKIVVGEEPDYEDTMEIAESVSDLLRLIVAQDHRMEKWL